MKTFKTNLEENEKLKCQIKECENRRHKRTKLCKECKKAESVINNAKRLNTGCKVWTVYRIDLDGYVYYGQTGTTLEARAAIHRRSALRGDIHPNSFIHQQIKERQMSGPEVFALMTSIIVTDKEYADEVESILISEATRCREKVCNHQKRFVPLAS